MQAPPPPPAPWTPPTTDSAVAAAITHAVYLTGGLVLLAIGVLEVAEAIGALAECLANSSSCFGEQVWYLEGPGLGGGLTLIVIAAVLIVLAHNARTNPRRF
jgi:hypothetical protein